MDSTIPDLRSFHSIVVKLFGLWEFKSLSHAQPNEAYVIFANLFIIMLQAAQIDYGQ